MHLYTYDSIYQITEVNYPAGYDYLATDTTFTYDAAGNRTAVIDAGGTSSYVTNALNQYTSAGGVSYDYDLSGNMTQDDRFQYAYDPENRLLSATKLTGTPGPLTAACDTTLAFTTGGDAEWFSQTSVYHDLGDAAQSGAIGDDQESWMETTVEGEGTLVFWWNCSSGEGDYLDFSIDGRYRATHTTGWQQKTYAIVGFGTHTLRWRYYKNASGSSGSDCGWVDYVQWTAASHPPVQSLATALDTNLSICTGGHADWALTTWPEYDGVDAARSGYLTDSQISEIQTTVSGSGTLSFYWKVSSEEYYDKLEFFVDGVRQGDPIDGEVDWTPKSVNVAGSGNHTLLWRYSKDSSGSEGSDRGYVDCLQWSGSGPIADPPTWETVSYTYDPAGRRIEKKVDGVTEVKFLYDGDHILAEYDASNTLLRKYIHGPCIDEPICLVEASGTYVGTQYYHYDALGSIVGLTNSAGAMVQFYEYSVYGQVAASDPNHPNRFMFTGREFDRDTGLYYYRARYYNPEIGRFLQTDPIGYGDGMNWYAYCHSNPINCADPSGQVTYSFLDLTDEGDETLTFAMFLDDGTIGQTWDFRDLDGWMTWAQSQVESESEVFTEAWQKSQSAWTLTEDAGRDQVRLFWSLQALVYLTVGYQDFGEMLDTLVQYRVTVVGNPDGYVSGTTDLGGPVYSWFTRQIRWDVDNGGLNWIKPGKDRVWWGAPNLAFLAHELGHAYDDAEVSRFGWDNELLPWSEEDKSAELFAIEYENICRYAFYSRVPGFRWVRPRPAFLTGTHEDVDWASPESGHKPWQIELDW